MKILAFDPGGTTGFAVGNLEEKEWSHMEVSAEQSEMTHSELFSVLVTSSPDWIVCESFEYRNKSRSGLELISCELIGVVKLYSTQYDKKLTMQTASQGKGHFTDQKLKNMGFYERGKPHGMDALRHLLHWYTFGPGFQFNPQSKSEMVYER